MPIRAVRPLSRVFSSADIRQYYDRNTGPFLRLGRSGDTGVIHRAVWAPGVDTLRDAFHYVDALVASYVRRLEPTGGGRPHVIDLGCGVGASLCYLAERLPIRGTGITLSRVQARMASRRIEAAGLHDRITCFDGDYCQLPSEIDTADLAYAIESFVHGPSPDRFFAEAARVLRPNAVLIICDDVARPTTDARALATVARFTRGWHLNCLLGMGALREIAARAGFELVSTTDLTPWLTPTRFHERISDLAGRLASSLPFVSARFASLCGSGALSACLRHGWISYTFMVFRRTAG